MISRLVLASLFAAVVAPATAADPAMGRFFFTPSQRSSLDVARSQRTRATVATEQTQEVVQPVPQTITYGGMVRRSDGRTTVWINDRAVDNQSSAGGTPIVRRVRPDGAVTLEVPQSNRRVDLKVGQSVEVLSGSVGEAYARPAPAPKPEPGTAAAEEPASQPPQGAQKPPAPDSARPGPRAESGALGQGAIEPAPARGN